MSIKYNSKSGEYTSVVQLDTGRRYESGAKIYVKRQRTFDTKTAAESWERKQKLSVKQRGADGVLSVSQLSEFTEAKQISGDEDLRVVAEFWRKHHPVGEQLTVRDCWERYESSKEWSDYKPNTRSNKRHGILKFVEVFGDTLISEVSIDDFETYLDRFENDATRNTNSSSVKMLFKWSAHRKQKYLSMNQLKFVEHSAVSYDEVKILTTDDVEKLFNKCVEVMPHMIPHIALQFFAGLRTSEIVDEEGDNVDRIRPRDFDFVNKTIYIRPEVTKTKGKGKEVESARLIEKLPDALWQWLDAVNFNGEIDIVGYSDRMRKLYKSADVVNSGNVGRHSFCSYGLGLKQNVGDVCKWSGHASVTVFRRHYAALVTSKEAEAYFDVRPKSKIAMIKAKPIKGATKELTDEGLIAVAEVMNNSQIAKAYGVSEAAIRKRLKKLSV